MATTDTGALVQWLINAENASIAEFEVLLERLRDTRTGETALSGDFVSLVRDLLRASGSATVAFLVVEEQYQAAVAEHFFPVAG